MSVLCALNAGFLILMVEYSDIWLAYTLYGLFRISYITVVTIATYVKTLVLIICEMIHSIFLQLLSASIYSIYEKLTASLFGRCQIVH